MHRDSHRHPPQDYRSNPTKEIDKVKTVMDACIANGIYGVIDWHSMGGAKTMSSRPRPSSPPWRRMYGKTPNIMYEPWNEPVQEAWPVIKAYHEAVITKIRAIDPDSIVICGSRHWDQECDEASKNPITIPPTSPIRSTFTRPPTGSRCATTGRGP